VFQALVDSARELGVRFHTGITATVETFYPDQERPGFGGTIAAGRDRFPVRGLDRLRIVNVEMECATLLTMAGVFGLRAGAVCTVYGDSPDGNPVPEDPMPAIRVANEALYRIAQPAPHSSDVPPTEVHRKPTGGPGNPPSGGSAGPPRARRR
jgi:uridine phosphorylase